MKRCLKERCSKKLLRKFTNTLTVDHADVSYINPAPPVTKMFLGL